MNTHAWAGTQSLIYSVHRRVKMMVKFYNPLYHHIFYLPMISIQKIPATHLSFLHHNQSLNLRHPFSGDLLDFA